MRAGSSSYLTIVKYASDFVLRTAYAIDALMAEVIEGHIRFHVVDPDKRPTSEREQAAQELIAVVNAYLG
jgi:hypothetical protein